MIAKIKDFVKSYHSEIVLSIGIICITIISFNLGKISAKNSAASMPMSVFGKDSTGTELQAQTTAKATPARDETVVASKAAKSHLYHFTWCPGAKQIADKNKITFPNEQAAISAGYSLAGNCTR